MKKTVKRKYVDNSLGFPVILLNVPMVRVRGEWALQINYNAYQEAVLTLLAYKPARLTGSEVSFIRKYFEMTIRGFAKRFSLQHTAVIKWEKKKGLGTKMSWSTEKDIRLFILDELKKKASELRKLYRELKKEMTEDAHPIKLDFQALVA